MAYCTKCGAKIPEGSKFCPNCGAPVNTDVSDASSAPVPADADMEEQYQSPGASEASLTMDQDAEINPRNTENLKTKKKRSKKPLIIVLVVVAVFIVALLALAAIGSGSQADQKVVYEGIEFRVPVKWKLNEDSSSDSGLYFYTNQRNSGEMLYMAAVPDVSYILNLFGADYVMDWMTEYIHEQTGGDTVDAQKVTTAGYETYVYDVTGVSTDVNGDTVQGGYRIACILNTDKSEMILIYAYGLSANEDDQKILTDIDYILENASVSSEANSY